MPNERLGPLERFRRRLGFALGPSYERPELDAVLAKLPYEPELLKTLYEENAKVSSVFWEWRHKLMTIFLSAVGALLIVAGWLYDRGAGAWTAVPIASGALVAFHCIRLESRNHAILGDSYRVGAAIEAKLAGREEAPAATTSDGTSEAGRAGAIFTLLDDDARRRYGRQLRWVFVSIGFAMTVAAAAIAICSPEPSSDRRDERAGTALPPPLR